MHVKRDVAKVLFTNTYGNNSGGNYRPIEVLLHQFDIRVFGDNPAGRHFTSLILHLLNVLLVYFLAWRLSKNYLVGFIGASLFAVFIIHSYSLSPVSWISGRVDTSVTLFYLISLILFIKSFDKESILYYLLSLAAFMISLMSKEMAISLPLIIGLYSVLFLKYKENDGWGKRNIYMFTVMLFIGIGIVIIGVLSNPNFAAKFLSKDHDLAAETIQKIIFFRDAFLIGGGLLAIISSIFLLFIKYSKTVNRFVTSIHYSIPFFLVLYLYIIVRYLVLGGLGGMYTSESGGADFFNFKFDTIFRDFLGLAGLFYPVGKEFHDHILLLQIHSPILFYSLSIIIFLFVIFMLYLTLHKKKKVAAFNFAWIFLTLLPVHNILISPWYYNQRYLYLTTVGFCVLAAILICSFIQSKKTSSVLKYGIVIIVTFIIMLKSWLIINHNSKLNEQGKEMKGLVENLTKYKEQIMNASTIYFLSYPTSYLDTKNCVFIEGYMDDLLNYVTGFKKSFEYKMVLFVDNNDNNYEVKWADDKNLTIDNLELGKTFIIPNKPSELDQQIKHIYGGAPYHNLMKPIPDKNVSTETNGTIVTTMETEMENNRAKVNVKFHDLSKPTNIPESFFIYRKDNLELLNTYSSENLQGHF